MLSKKINAALKRAYYYFGFKKVVPYYEVNETILKFKGLPDLDEELANKINQYADEIEEYFDTPEKREDDTVTDFAKKEPRKSWEHYSDDFDFDINDLNEENLVESVEPVAGKITPVPGGVGPMTIAGLMNNCYQAAVMKHDLV